MEIRQLQTFLVVAEELNFTRAAIRLNYSQPTITKHLKSLENEIGVSLFYKEGGRKKLTRAGESLYNHSKNIIYELTEFNHKMESFHDEKRLIQVCGLDHYCFHYFLPQIEKFQRRYPVSIEIHATTNDGTLINVLHHDMDFGIAVGKQLPSELAQHCVGYEDLVLFASKKIAKDASFKEYCIQHYPVLLDQKANYIYYGFLKQGLTFPKMIHCNTDEAVMNGVLNNSFIGILGTGRLEEKIKNGQITILDTYASHVPVKLFTLASNLENPLMNKFFNSFQNSFPVCDFING